MTRLILVRHGETSWNREGRYQGQIDSPLSELGLIQGDMVADALAGVPIDQVYSSPLSRAYITAAKCAARHNLPVVKDERLLEISHGKWEGLMAEDVHKDYPELLQRWRSTVIDVQMPGGESIEDVRQRARDAIGEYVQKHAGQTVLVVAHDAVNKALICDFWGMGLEHFWQIKQDNTCINVFEYEDEEWRLILLNSTVHLGFLFSGLVQRGL